MFKKILIANRGEIACRIIRTLHSMNIEALAVFSDADSKALFVKNADHSVNIGPSPSTESYLRADKIIKVALENKCDAIHPGYGFLSENPDFVRNCEKAGITFIGPTAKSIESMADKVVARSTMQRLGIPVIKASSGGALPDVESALKAADKIGYPVMVKASNGGGGIGMSLVKKSKKLEKAFLQAKRRAKSAFSSDDVYLEKFIENPHHIEIQILGDGQSVVHLFERECSVQRRFQKIIEEAPSPFPKVPCKKMFASVTSAIEKIGYVNAGTVECLVDSKGEYYFLEVNRRVQVEHPVTEMITGHDIVKDQIHIAATKTLPYKQSDITFKGHAIEYRIYAEDPWNFLPSPGRLDRFIEPEGEGIRVDSGVFTGYDVPMYYDPLLAKLIVYGKDREEALKRSEEALQNFIVEGIKTNIPLHRRILRDELFIQGNYTTHYLDDLIKRLKLLNEIN